MPTLKGFQRKYLRGLAHSKKPVVQIGQRGLTESVLQEIDNALLQHELIKVRFNEYKEKENKQKICTDVEQHNSCELVGLIGHNAIFYRQHPEAEQREIKVPTR